MSVHDRVVRREPQPDVLDLKCRPAPGRLRDFLTRHRLQVTVHSLASGKGRPPKASPHYSHARPTSVPRIAWDYLRRFGGKAPRPDGCTYAVFNESDVWHECRYLRDQIKSGEYHPSQVHVVWIDKGGGRGKRPLVIQSIFDRVVQRAVVEIVQPLLDPRFDDRSFGFRPAGGRLHVGSGHEVIRR